jgi:signal peptidase II
MLSYNLPIAVLPIFDLRLLHNTGAAFSFLANEEGWQRWLFVAIAVVVSGLIVHWLRQTEPKQKIQALGYASILGGALGNLFDRIVHGYVVDFLSFHYAGWYFPAFNIADMGITLGAIALIADALFLSKDRSK